MAKKALKGPLESEAIPTKEARKSIPVISEYEAQPGFWRDLNRRAKMKQVTINPVKPIVPTTKCIKPCELMGLFSKGVAGGKASGGSALKILAPIRPKL